MAKTPLKILRKSQVADRTGLSATTIDELEKRDLFPKSVPLTKRTRGHLEHEIEAWLQARKALRDLDNEHLLKTDPILNADLSRTGDAA